MSRPTTLALDPRQSVRGGDTADAAATQVDGAVVGDRFACTVGEVVIDTMHPIAVWATCAFGAAARKRFIAPHSSASR